MKNFKMVAFSVLLTLIGCDSDGQDINDEPVQSIRRLCPRRTRGYPW